MATQDNLLTINNLTVNVSIPQGQQNTIINNISLTIKRGEIFALVGASGSGKSITSLAIMQLLPFSAKIQPNSKIFLDQQDLLELPEVAMQKIRGRRIGMIFQEPMTSLNPVIIIGKQIEETLRIHLKIPRKLRKARAIELLTLVGISDPSYCYQQYSYQLSGGMQQRVMIAMAVATQPDLLIADEPTSALDVTIQAQILNLLRELQKKTSMSVLLITHDLAVVQQVADRVAVMCSGEIVEQTDVSDFFKAPQHPYSQKLVEVIIPRYREKPVTNKPMIEQKNVLLKVSNLRVYFPIRKGIFKRRVGWIKAVDGVDFTLNAGETLAIVGESGSGKSTAGKSILQLIKPIAGSVVFQNKELAQLQQKELQLVRRDLQIIFQDPYSAMDPRMMVGDIIAEGMLALNVVQTETEKQLRIDTLLQQVGLPIASKYRYPHEFSGGQRQRVCIARALAVSPKLIVCDEPTSALDVSAQMQVLTLLKGLQTTLGLSYFFITHNLAVVGYLANQVAVMYQGQIVEYGSVCDVLTRPRHPYTKSLLAAAPFVS